MDSNVIHTYTIPYSSPIFMVLNIEGNLHTCPKFHALNKLTIKDKFPILVFDDFFNEFHGA